MRRRRVYLGLVLFVIVCGMGVAAYLGSRLRDARDVCFPYVLLTHYRHDGRLMAVCANGEQRRVDE